MTTNNNLIAKVSNGFGNQMFLYATSYAFSKKMDYTLLLDIETGIKNLKKIDSKKKFKHYKPKFELDIFNISAKKADRKYRFDFFLGYFTKKIIYFLDKISNKKRTICEIKKNDKKTSFDNNLLKKKFNSNVYIDGYFESEKYFNEYRQELLKEFSFKDKINCNPKYLKMITSTNSVSMAIRRDRYSEFKSDNSDSQKIKKTLDFENLQYEYIYRSMEFIKKKISSPKFYLFSDNFDGLKNIFTETDDLFFIDTHLSNKTIEDFYLMYNCKHYIVAPTSFHWWAAWLNQNPNKICLKPKNINSSNNIDFWPDSWISI